MTPRPNSTSTDNQPPRFSPPLSKRLALIAMAIPVVIKNVGFMEITVDANHPLAGVTLNFDVEITEIRDATAEESTHGHVHGPGGHHH